MLRLHTMSSKFNVNSLTRLALALASFESLVLRSNIS